MSQELIQKVTGEINAASVEIESQRAIAEAQGQLTLAKKFPRDTLAAMAEMKEACKYPSFAAVAFYTVPNRGSGLSIRAAEEIARIYGNIQYGHRELSRSKGKSEIEVFAWDMEKNNRSIRQITVEHVLDTKNGSKKLTDQADIDNRIANIAAKQMRGRILALVPKFMVAECIEDCKKTLAGGNDMPMAERVKRILAVFAALKISQKHLEKYIGNPISEITLDQIADLTGVRNAIKEGANISDYFDIKTPSVDREKIKAEIEEQPKTEQEPIEEDEVWE